MELRELILLIVALVVSGIVAYKTLQWVIYEEIGIGLASILLGFSILVFLAITNYDVIKRISATGQSQLPTSKESTQDSEPNGANSIRWKPENEREDIQAGNPGLERLLSATGHSAEEAKEMAQAAIRMARETKEQFERLSSIQAWAAWNCLMSEFLEVEDYLVRWEQRHGLRRDTNASVSTPELEERLEVLGKSTELPESIRLLYLKRQEKYEILVKLKEATEPYARQYVQIDLHLPSPPKLPSRKRSASISSQRP